MADRLRQLARLSPRERGLLGAAWLLLVLARPALRLLSVARLLPPPGPRARRGPAVPVERLVTVVAIAGRRRPRASCLPQALVLGWLLRWHGVPAAVRIGVARDGERLRAHAWVEHEGRPLAGQPDDEVFAALAASGRA